MNAAPQPLRWKATLVGSIAATGAGGLLLAAGADALLPPGDDAWLAVDIALWVFIAGGIYAANQQWIGRSRGQQITRYALCLAIAIPMGAAILVLTMAFLVNAIGFH
jgi:hypothetical protein